MQRGKNVQLAGRQNRAKLRAAESQSDITLLTLNNKSVSKQTIPSDVYLAGNVMFSC